MVWDLFLLPQESQTLSESKKGKTSIFVFLHLLLDSINYIVKCI